jgi:hypothetical protein
MNWPGLHFGKKGLNEQKQRERFRIAAMWKAREQGIE